MEPNPIEVIRRELYTIWTVLGLGFTVLLALMVYFGQDVGGQLRDMNARFDRFLERQADAAAAANARFDRLLEQRALQPVAPLVIQLPQQAPAVSPSQLAPPPG